MKIKQLPVHQMAGCNILQRLQNHFGAPWKLLFPIAQHLPHALALHIVLRATHRAARNNRKLAMLRPANNIALAHISQRAYHRKLAIITHQLGRHGLELGSEKHIHEESGNNIVAMVPQRNLVYTQPPRHRIQNTAPQARAQAAQRLALWHHLLDNAVNILLLNVKRHAQPLQIRRQHIGWEIGQILVQINRNNLKPNGRALLQLEQNIEQGIAIFAATHAHHHLVALFNHVEVHDCLARLAAKALFQLNRLTPRPCLRRMLASCGLRLCACIGIVSRAGGKIRNKASTRRHKKILHSKTAKQASKAKTSKSQPSPKSTLA